MTSTCVILVIVAFIVGLVGGIAVTSLMAMGKD
jgi:hypothetical protein